MLAGTRGSVNASSHDGTDLSATRGVRACGEKEGRRPRKVETCSMSAHEFAVGRAPRFRSLPEHPVARGRLELTLVQPGRGLRATSRSTRPSLERSSSSIEKPSACTCSSGSRRTWSAPKRSNAGATSRWAARVEGGVLELERLRVPQPQIDRPTQLSCASAGEVQHRGHEFDSRESDAIGVVRKVESRPHGDLHHLTLSLGADPLTPTGEQQPFRELDVPVVVGRLPPIDTADGLGLLKSWAPGRRQS
jgi:hypothetical protein